MERRVHADEIRVRATAADRNGLALEAVTIEGTLDLSATSLPSLVFVGCRFERELILRGASVESLFLGGCDLAGIDARDAHLRADLQLCAGTRSGGLIRLEGARIDGNLSCTNALLEASGGEALRADRAVIGGHVIMSNGFRASGAVVMPHISVGGMLYCAHGLFANNGGVALTLEGASIGGNIVLSHGFKGRGEVILRDARCGGMLYCPHGTFENPGGNALTADGVGIGGRAFIGEWFAAKGAVRLRNAQVGGDLHCVGGLFQNPGADAINAERITVGGSVRMHTRFLAQGAVRLDASRIGGSLNCSGGRFDNRQGAAESAERGQSKGVALSAVGMRVDRDVVLGSGFRATGIVHLDHARIGGTLETDDAVYDDLTIEDVQSGSPSRSR